MKPLKKRKSPLHHDPKSHLDKDHSQKSPHFSPKKRGSSFLILALTFLAVIAFAWFSLRGGVASVIHEDVPLNTLINRYASGVYDEIIIEDGILTANRKEALVVDALGRSRRTIESDRVLLPPNDSITELWFLNASNPTKVKFNKNIWLDMLVNYLPSILMFLIIGYIVLSFMLRITGGANSPMAFIKSRARMYDPNASDKVTFSDVAWAEEEKEDLAEIVDFLKNPKRYKDIGAKIPRGILMIGAPGTGKTLLARAVAGESNVPFFSISGSEFVEMFVGVGAARVRDLFHEAKEKAPSIIFIDEIDAIGKRRSPGIGGGHDEREQTLNQILTEMDGFDNETNVIVLAATNRADVLDKALLRPGRFDRKVTINLPNLEDRTKILEVHAKNKPLENVDLRKIAATTVGFSGADLANLLNEAAILCGKLHSKVITQDMIQQSIEKIVMGNTRKSLKMTDLDKKITAVHEAGHALVRKLLPGADYVQKVTILSRWSSLGATWFLPEKDEVLVSKEKYLDELASIYGGRAAEEIYFGKEKITTGAASDIERATKIARAMIAYYGFDDELGAENFITDRPEGNFLDSEWRGKVVSDKTQEIIDEKVRSLIRDSYNKARTIIADNRVLHESIVSALLEKETLSKEDFDALFEPKVAA